MLKTETLTSDNTQLEVNAIEEKGSLPKDSTTFLTSKIVPMSKEITGGNPSSPAKMEAKPEAKPEAKSESKPEAKSASSAAANPYEWEEVKKARNRINSQRIRERERAQIANLEAERARLWLSNDAIRFQNQHFREIIAKIKEICELKRTRSIANGGLGIGGTGIPTAPETSSVLAASLGATGALGGGASMQMSLSMRQNANMISGLGGGLDSTGLFQNRLTASAKSLSGLSDADLLARHQATTLEMQNMVRQQEAMDRFGAGAGVGMGSLINNGMTVNGMNMNAVSASPYAEMADNLRIRQLMLQQSATSDFDPSGLLSSISGGASNPLGTVGGGGITGVDLTAGNANSNGLSFGVGALGDLGSGVGDADLLQLSKRQKLGF